jgi:hypothetical protein
MYHQENAARQVNGGRKWCCSTNAGSGDNNHTAPKKSTPRDEVTVLAHIWSFFFAFMEMGYWSLRDDTTGGMGLQIGLLHGRWVTLDCILQVLEVWVVWHCIIRKLTWDFTQK